VIGDTPVGDRGRWQAFDERRGDGSEDRSRLTLDEPDPRANSMSE